MPNTFNEEDIQTNDTPTSEDLYPVILNNLPDITPTRVTSDTPETVFDDADADIIHLTMSALLQGWNHVRDIDSLCKMATTTMKAVSTRREIFGKVHVPEKKGKTFLGALE